MHRKPTKIPMYTEVTVSFTIFYSKIANTAVKQKLDFTVSHVSTELYPKLTTAFLRRIPELKKTARLMDGYISRASSVKILLLVSLFTLMQGN